MANKITDVRAREIFDCRWIPTVQVEIEVDGKTVGVGNKCYHSGFCCGGNCGCKAPWPAPVQVFK